MAMKMKQFHALRKFGPEKCLVYLRLPWLSSVSNRFEKQVKSAVKQCFSAVEPRVVYSTNELLPATNKYVLPALQKSNVIYQFSCHCDSRYVGRTSQTLLDRIKQHVPKSIRSCSSSQNRLLPARRCKSSTQTNTQFLASDSAIGLHLLQNPTCAQHYDDSRFSILAQGRSPFHLSDLEATFIKTSNPALCRQKRIQLKDCTLKTLSRWTFSSQLRLKLFPINSRVVHILSIFESFKSHPFKLCYFMKK